MRYIRYAIQAAIAICLVTIALANREMITLNLLPSELSLLIGYEASVTLPLFIAIFIGILIGLLLGFVWEWLREHKHRADAAAQRREKERLAKEVAQIKAAPGSGKTDDVLALLEDAGAAR